MEPFYCDGIGDDDDNDNGNDDDDDDGVKVDVVIGSFLGKKVQNVDCIKKAKAKNMMIFWVRFSYLYRSTQFRRNV